MAYAGFVAVAFAYCLGSITFAVVVARRHGVDIRKEGSKNPGATNVRRVLGRAAGRRVLLLDVAKGMAAAGLPMALLGADNPWTAAAGFAAVFGHMFPIWYGFRGGKGVATTAGVLLATLPLCGLATLLVYVVAKKATGFASVGSLAGTLAAAALALGLTFVSGPLHAPPTLVAMTSLLFLLVLVRHMDNLRRLARGTELPS